MEAPTVRPPDPEEVETLADLWVALAAGQRDHGSNLLAGENRSVVREAFARQLVTDGVRVAADDEVVGFVSFAVETGSYRQDRTRGLVRNLFVSPGHRDRGIGGDLLATAERCLAERGAEVVALEAMADNDAARRFYRRHDYAPSRVEFEKPVESDTRRD